MNRIEFLKSILIGFTGFIQCKKTDTEIVYPIESTPKLIKECSLYKIWEKFVKMSPDEEFFKLEFTTNEWGDYIGTKEDAEYLCDELGIYPQLIDKYGKTCRLGFSPQENKWYGWSHRGINGFTYGDKVTKGSVLHDCGMDEGFIAKTFDDCKLMAEFFAHYVG